jgi:hypothetical protein
MIEVAVAQWAMWTADTEPDVSFLPPLLRRRCSRLTRTMLDVAYRVCSDEDRGAVPVVFASRYAEAAATLGLLQTLARREPLTASGFSHSVHNAQAGLFAIAAKNRSLSSAVAAGRDTFGAAFVEAVAAMRRSRRDTALLVVADEALPDVFAMFQDERPLPYALALLFGPHGIRLGFEPGVGRPSASSEPHAVAFARWLDGAGDSLTLGARTPYTWTRR